MPFPAPLPFHLLLLLPVLSSLALAALSTTSASYFNPECGNDFNPPINPNTQPCFTPSNATWTPRAFAHTFEWSGANWIAGGYRLNGEATINTNDVWGSYDQGHSWVNTTSLPGPCASSTSLGQVYAGAVYLFCSGYSLPHAESLHVSTGGPSSQVSYVNGDRTLTAPWTAIADGLNNRMGFSVNLLAVPFDGTGTLILLGGGQSAGGTAPIFAQNDVWTFSNTGYDLTSPSPCTGDLLIPPVTPPPKGVPQRLCLYHYLAPTGCARTHVYPVPVPVRVAAPLRPLCSTFSPAGVWTQFNTQPGGTVPYTAPYPARLDHSTTTDAEGLVIIITGGTTGTVTLNDVWQMSWMQHSANPLFYVINTGANNFSARKAAALYRVHDWLYLYGGSTDGPESGGSFPSFTYSNSLDDVWQSPDYGVTWNFLSATGTGTARHGVTPLSVSRRLFIMGGAAGAESADTAADFLNDVYIQFN